jgi:hypothetical protein
MSQENVEIVRGIWDADRRRDVEAEDVQVEFGEVAEGGDNVVVTYRAHGGERGSGAVVDQAITLIWTRETKGSPDSRLWGSARALEAAGLQKHLHVVAGPKCPGFVRQPRVKAEAWAPQLTKAVLGAGIPMVRGGSATPEGARACGAKTRTRPKRRGRESAPDRQ